MAKSNTRIIADLIGQIPAIKALNQSIFDLATASGFTLTDQSERLSANLDGGPSLILLPGDTAAQMTFVRNSIGFTRHPDGFLAPIAVNGIRYDYRRQGTTWVPAGFLIEDSRTNLVQRSTTQFASSPWSGSAVVSDGSTTGPDAKNGSLAGTGSTITDNSTAALDKFQSFAVPANSSFESSIMLKRVSGTNAPSIRLNFNNGGNPEIIYDLDNGLVMPRGAIPAGFTPFITAEGNGYWRCGLYGTDTTASTQITMALRPAFAATYTTAVDTAATGSVYAANADFKLGVGPTSIIQSPLSATATRGGDILTKTLSTRINRVAMTTMFSFRLLPGSVGGTLWQYDNGNNSNRIYVATESGRIVLRVANAGAFTAFIQGPLVVADTDYNVTFSFHRLTGELLLRVNGTNYTGTASAIPTVTTRRIGNDVSGNTQPNAWINPFRTKNSDGTISATEFLRVLTASELAVFLG